MGSKTGRRVLAYTGVQARNPTDYIRINRAPTVKDYKDYFIGTFWLHTPVNDLWHLVSKNLNQGNWIRLSSGAIETLTGDVGTAVSPDASFNIDVFGSGPYIFTGTPASNLLTLSDDGTVATQYDGDLGSAVPIANVLEIVGLIGGHISTLGTTNKISISVDGDIASQYDTDAGSAAPIAGVLQVLGGELIGTTGGTNIVTANLDRGTDGQVIIGATGAISAYANITSTLGTIAVTNSPNAINVETVTVPPTTLGYTNLGITVDTGASTITINSASGAAFSATNVGTVTFASKATPGILVTCNITANVSMDWSDMDGNTMGTEGSKAWADQLPLYVYGVLNDAENDCTFGLARMPHHAASGITANIGTPATPNADEDISLFLFESVTITDYDDNPVVIMGSVKATKDASDQWTFIALKGGSTGIGGFMHGTVFSMPALQNGAQNNHVWSNLATVPVFTTSHMFYGITSDGTITIDLSLNGVSTIGAGANFPLWVMAPLNGTVVRDAGTFNVASQSVSNAALRGTYRGLYIDGPQANGFYVIEFVKVENDRLYIPDFDTLTGAASQLAGSLAYTLQNNQLP